MNRQGTIVNVKPLSKKAKNRLVNLMENNPKCLVEQDTGASLFLASQNRKYFFWVPSLDATAAAEWEIL